jgi:hypothetical protein
MILIPEAVYEGLLANTKHSDPFDKQVDENNRKISEILKAKIPSDTKNKLYDSKIRQIKSLKKLKPESQIERDIHTITPAITTPTLTKNNVTENEITTPLDITQKEETESVKSDDTTYTAELSTPRTEIIGKLSSELLKRKKYFNSKGQIYNKHGQIVSGSRMEKSIKYFLNGQKGKAPNGFNAIKHLFQLEPIKQLLQKSQIGTGAVFKFKPRLWKRH